MKTKVVCCTFSVWLCLLIYTASAAQIKVGGDTLAILAEGVRAEIPAFFRSRENVFILISNQSKFCKSFVLKSYKADSINLFFGNRAYLAGYSISLWVSVEDILIDNDRAYIIMNIFSSNDPWIQSEDRLVTSKKLSFHRMENKWTLEAR